MLALALRRPSPSPSPSPSAAPTPEQKTRRLMAPARRNATMVAPPTAGMSYQRPIMKRVQSELEIVRGLLNKAEALVASKRSHGGAAAAAHSKVRPRHRLDKSKRFLHHPDARPEATDGAAGSRRRTSPLVEVIEPTMPIALRDQLAGLLSSLSAEMPPHIVEFMQLQCNCTVVNGDEMEIDFHNTKDAVLFQLKNLLEEFGEQRKIRRLEAAESEPPKNDITRSSPSHVELEDGEAAEMAIDICGGASAVAVEKVQLSPPAKQEEEFIDICGGASPVSIDKFPGTPRSSSSESSSSSSSSSGSSSWDSASESDDAVSPIETVRIPLEQQEKKLTERAASPATEMRELIARTQEKHKLRRELNRKRAREELEEMERTARSMSNSIDPVDMKLLGISAVEYNVSPVKSRNSVRHRGSLLQQLGFFLKPEC
ncbi:hypothetical protein ABZP36_013338 [Zizania latifolia]